MLRILIHSLLQFWALFGVFIVGGAALTLLARWQNNAFRQFRFPQLGLYLFGGIGIPVHEFSHAFFCKLFRHEIQSVKWFDARGKGESHGSVTHLYDPWNPYHRVGHFFIGLGPALLGPCLLAILFYICVPQGRALFHFDGHFHGPLAPFLVRLAQSLGSRASLSSPAFYVFLYLSSCIASQIELSPEDLKQAAAGIIPILIILFLINVLAWALGWHWHGCVLDFAARESAVAVFIFVFAAVLSGLTLALWTCVFGLLNVITGKDGINPFKNA